MYRANSPKTPLKQLDNAVVLQASILKLKEPTRRVREILNEFIDDNRSALKDKDKGFLDPGLQADLIALANKEFDPMTTFLLTFFARLFQTEVIRKLFPSYGLQTESDLR
jgi:hypothetical protein